MTNNFFNIFFCPQNHTLSSELSNKFQNKQDFTRPFPFFTVPNMCAMTYCAFPCLFFLVGRTHKVQARIFFLGGCATPRYDLHPPPQRHLAPPPKFWHPRKLYILCSSRKYPYPPPPHGRDFLYDPPYPSGISKSTPTVTPPTRLEIPVFYYFLFLYLPPGNLVFNCLVLYFIYQKQLLIKTTSILFTFLYKYINIHGRFMQVH